MAYKKKILKRFVSYYKPHKLFIADMVCAFSMASIDLIFPVITRFLLQKVIPEGNVTLMFTIIGSLIGMYVLQMLLNYFINYYGHNGHIVGIRMEYDMRKDLFSHLQTLSFRFYDNVRTGKLMSRMMNDLNEITELDHHGPEDIFLSVIML
ncbi:MAG: hypothetical protein HPY74_08855 [Firmicutes bacterium]|nr:hypothetical protein [Bacillota bacterium]